MKAKTSFELRVIPRGEGEYGLSLFQVDNDRLPEHVVRVWGRPLQTVFDQVIGAVKKEGYRVTNLSRQRKAPFVLDEASGVRLGLLFLSIKPLSKLSRIEAISSIIRGMGEEETYYWFSKCTKSLPASARRAQRAMRILLAQE